MKRKPRKFRKAYRQSLFRKTERVGEKKLIFSFRKISFLAMLGLCGGGLFYFLFFSNYFNIINITVRGNEYLSEQFLQQLAQQQMVEKKFF